MSRIAGVPLLCLVVIVISDVPTLAKNEGVFDKIKAGLQYATNYLETAKDIADLVANSLGRKQKAKDESVRQEEPRPTFGPPNVVSAFFRLLGLDSQKITAIAVNSVIFLAQLISSLFDLTPKETIESRSAGEPWDPMKFILENENERVQNLIEQAHDDNLPNQLIDRMDGFDSACIRLFLCKTSPVIRAAQDSLRNNSQRGARRVITAWLPSRDEFERNADECEDAHADCDLFPD